MKTNTIVVAPIAFLVGIATFTLLLVNLVTSPTIVYGQDAPEETTEVVEETHSEDEAHEGETAEEHEAHSETDETHETDEVDTKTTDASPVFEYVAVECDTLTHFVRRSIILFDEANDDINLSQEAIIYAETNIVQEIGPRLLAIGETVTVDSSLVEKYANSSSDLTEAQVNAWKPYTANVNFDTERIEPTNDVEEATKTQEQRADEQAQAEQANDGLSEADTVTGDDDQASALWWVAGGGAVAGLWYLLYRRNEA